MGQGRWSRLEQIRDDERTTQRLYICPCLSQGFLGAPMDAGQLTCVHQPP